VVISYWCLCCIIIQKSAALICFIWQQPEITRTALAKFHAWLSGGPDPPILAHRCFTIHRSEEVLQETDISYNVCGYHYK
jgi:hypothetical protein